MFADGPTLTRMEWFPKAYDSVIYRSGEIRGRLVLEVSGVTWKEHDAIVRAVMRECNDWQDVQHKPTEASQP